MYNPNVLPQEEEEGGMGLGGPQPRYPATEFVAPPILLSAYETADPLFISQAWRLFCQPLV